jgi:hypothetical protein
MRPEHSIGPSPSEQGGAAAPLVILALEPIHVLRVDPSANPSTLTSIPPEI